MDNNDLLLAIEKMLLKPIHDRFTPFEALPKQIQPLAESQQQTNAKLDALQETVERMESTVTALDILHQIRPHKKAE